MSSIWGNDEAYWARPCSTYEWRTLSIADFYVNYRLSIAYYRCVVIYTVYRKRNSTHLSVENKPVGIN